MSTQEDEVAVWKGGGGAAESRRSITSDNGQFPMQNGRVKFDPPKVPVIFVLGGQTPQLSPPVLIRNPTTAQLFTLFTKQTATTPAGCVTIQLDLHFIIMLCCLALPPTRQLLLLLPILLLLVIRSFIHPPLPSVGNF